MSWADIETSFARAATRLGAARTRRRRRSDAGEPRVHSAVLNELARLLFTQALPMPQVVDRVRAFSRRRGDRVPSRAAIYQWARTVPAPPVPVAELPPFARDALYNLAGTPLVPADQLAFCCFNYGDTRAIAYAAALPRPVLSRALSTPGWRPKSRALARAVLLSRRRADARARASRSTEAA